MIRLISSLAFVAVATTPVAAMVIDDFEMRSFDVASSFGGGATTSTNVDSPLHCISFARTHTVVAELGTSFANVRLNPGYALDKAYRSTFVGDGGATLLNWELSGPRDLTGSGSQAIIEVTVSAVDLVTPATVYVDLVEGAEVSRVIRNVSSPGAYEFPLVDFASVDPTLIEGIFLGTIVADEGLRRDLRRPHPHGSRALVLARRGPVP